MALGYFAQNGWHSTLLSVNPKNIEAKKEDELSCTIPSNVEVSHVSAISAQWTRLLGFGGIGFRAYGSLKTAGDRILKNEGTDAVYFSSTVFASFLLGPYWKRKHGVPYFIDYQDPWWSEYYSRHGAPKPPGGWLKYGIVQWLARKNEGRVIRGAAGVTCVSGAYVEMLRKRYPDVPPEKFIELPFGAPERDFDFAERGRREGGSEVWRYIGRGGQDMSVAVRIFGKTVEEFIKKRVVQPDKIDFQIAGTSYATRGRPEKTIEPILKEECSTIQVTEGTDRIGYMETLRRLMGSDRLVLFGSDDAGYTASKLYPYILAKRPLLVICREESSVARIVRETKSAELITLCDEDLGSRIQNKGRVMPEWEEAMGRWLAMDPAREPATDWKAFERYTARKMTEKLCRFFDQRLEAEKRRPSFAPNPSKVGGGAWPPETCPHPSDTVAPRRSEIPLPRGDSEGLRRQVEGGGGQETTKPKVLLFHPGVQHAPRLAEALEREGMLRSFWTGWAKSHQETVKFKPGWRDIRIPKGRYRTQPWVEFGALALNRTGWVTKKVWHWRNRIFQKRIPQQEIDGVDMVIGFDTASWILARRAKEAGKKFVLDRSIGHPAARKGEMRKIGCGSEIWPEAFAARSKALTEAEKIEHDLADLVVVGSKYAKRTLVEQGVGKQKIRVLPYGVGEDFLHVGQRRGVRKAGEKTRFLFVGQLSARKGLHHLMEAWGEMNQGEAELVLMGGGEWRKKAKEGVVFRGASTRKEVLAEMGRSDVLVFPSLFEGFGLVILEAMAAGLPVITTQNTGGPDVIEEGKEGFIVPAGNARALREKMEWCVRHPDKVAKMGKTAHSRAMGLTWKKYGEEYGRMMREVVGKKD